jgi:hypothetical protein
MPAVKKVLKLRICSLVRTRGLDERSAIQYGGASGVADPKGLLIGRRTRRAAHSIFGAGAAPVSLLLVFGQELRGRNSPGGADVPALTSIRRERESLDDNFPVCLGLRRILGHSIF